MNRRGGKSEKTFIPGIVRRVQDVSAIDSKASARALDAVLLQPALNNALRAGEERKLHATAMGPIIKILQQDKEATQAMQALAVLRRARLTERASPRLSVASLSDVPPWGVSSYNLPQGRTLFFPPYDLAPECGVYGSPVSARSTASAPDGRDLLVLEIPLDTSVSGARVASASVGIVIEPSQVGTIVVRPLCRYDGAWCYHADLFSTHTEGHVTLTAQSENQEILAHRDISIWDETTWDGSWYEDVGSYALAAEFEVRFSGQPGHQYSVFTGASISGDQSGNISSIGIAMDSYFFANLNVSIPWITVELNL